jgi:hypothetical protein
MHIVNFDEPAKPDPLTIVDMAKGPQNASVRSPKVTIELIEIKGQARVKQLSSSPRRVTSVSKQKLFQLRHEENYMKRFKWIQPPPFEFFQTKSRKMTQPQATA